MEGGEGPREKEIKTEDREIAKVRLGRRHGK